MDSFSRESHNLWSNLLGKSTSVIDLDYEEVISYIRAARKTRCKRCVEEKSERVRCRVSGTAIEYE